MHNKKNIVIVVIVSLALLGLGVWYFWASPDLYIVKNDDAIQSVVQKQAAKTKPTQPLPKSSPPPTEKSLLKMIADNPQAKKLFTLGQGRNKNVSFYGKVIDQRGEPVSHAKVTFSVGRWSLLDPDGYRYFGYTDANGMVEFDGETGFSLSVINIEKQGYDVNTHGAGFRAHAQYQGDTTTKLWGNTSKDKPYIFHAWKKTEAEPLVYSDGFFGFYDSGKPYTIDIHRELKHKGIVGGDLIIVMQRSANGTRHEPSDWSVNIRAIDGGLVETKDIFMNQAPEDGYINSWSISRKKGEQNFSSELTRKFYLKSRGGVYSKIHVRFLPYYKDEVGVVEVLAWVNPNGSRNLQYDPEKRIYPK